MRSHAAAVVASLLAAVASPLAAVEITRESYEGRPQFVVRTESATYFYDRAGGGFSRLIDGDGRDWIAFSRHPLREFPASSSAGFRGLPNVVFGETNPDAGAGHPGFDHCRSVLVDEHTIRTVSVSGRWEWTWVFTEDTATMIMERADPAHSWWFLYEGPIAGSFAPADKFWGTDAGGPRTEVPDMGGQLFERFRWIYFGDRNVPRVLLLFHHQPDALDDTVWFLGSSEGGAPTAPDGMLVFGFGRGPGTTPLLQGAGQRFTIGFVELESAGASAGPDLRAPDFHRRLADRAAAVAVR